MAPAPRRARAGLALALALACSQAEAPAPEGPGPTARPELVEALRKDLAAPRHPGDGGGRAWLEAVEPERPPAGSRARFVLGFEAGPEGVARGGSVQLQVSPFWGWSTPQVSDPDAPGYTEVTTPAEGVELHSLTLDRQLLGIEVGGRALAAGERLRIVYGAGPAGAVVDRFAEGASPFFFGVDADGDGVRAFLADSPSVEIAAGPAARLRLLGPATARPGDTLHYRLTVLDAAGNTGVPFAGRIELEVPAELAAPASLDLVAADAGRSGFTLEVGPGTAGVLRLRARGPDGLAAESPPLRVAAHGARILWGDLHGHSVLSDGTGTPEDFYRYAREVAALDVAALTDHDHWGLPFLDQTPSAWQRIQEATRRAHAPGRFVALHGYEWTNWIFGHRHVLFFDDEPRLHSSIAPETDEPGELWAALRGHAALTFAHHSAGGPVATDWRVPPDPELEPVTEIVSVHGSSEAPDSPFPIYSPLPGNFVRDVLGRGARLGFIGSGDGHDGHPGLAGESAPSGGLAGILADDATREAVLAALRARRVYATNGPRILLEASLDGRPMGSRLAPEAGSLSVEIAAPGPLERVDLVGREGVLQSLALEGRRDASLRLELAKPASGDFRYVRVVQRDGGAAWSARSSSRRVEPAPSVAYFRAPPAAENTGRRAPPLRDESLLDGLNPEQRAAVETTEGPLLVLAGAGSGKTRVLTHRIAWLVGGCGIAPEALLAVTFTNKAAGEMKERVAKLLGPGGEDVWVATFHSTCVRILRREIHHLERSRSFVIYDEGDSLGSVKEALRRHQLDPKAHEPRRLRWRIDQWKNAGWGPKEARERAEDIDAERAAEIYATYQKVLLEADALDFNDLLAQTVLLFERCPEVLERYRSRWQYVMVDEYQDTNRVQYQLVNQLASGHRNLCVVGDPDQSVYGWRGADVRNILDFERDFEGARVVRLERNYRSTQPILSAAGAVVANNRDRKDKQMVAERGEGESVRLFEARDDREEAQHVVQSVLEGVRGGGRPYGHFAVFYRTNAQSRPIEEALLEYDVPYVVVGGVRFYERAEVKDVLAWLRLVVNPADAMALRRALGSPPRGIGKTTLGRAEDLAAREGLSLLEGLRRHAPVAAGRTAARIHEFLELLEGLSLDLREAQPDEAISRVLERSGYLRSLERESTPEAESRIENLRELLTGAEDFSLANRDIDLGERTALEVFLDQVALVSDLDGWDERSERVSLMTAHSAKGLEFPVVFLVGMEEGVFPHAAASREGRAIEEERRLCYVGMTRAMERLTLTWARERRRYGSRTFGAPSRFLSEIPAALAEGDRPEHERHGGVGEPSLDYSYGQAAAGEAGGVAPGTRVRHPIFGPGSVLEVSGSGPRQKLRIRFDRVGVKTVVLRFANLEFG